MNEPQAEAVTEVIHGSIRDATAHLATRNDLVATESRLDSRLLGLEARVSGLETEMSIVGYRLEARISALESRLTWRLFGMMIGTAGLVVTVLRLFPPCPLPQVRHPGPARTSNNFS